MSIEFMRDLAVEIADQVVACRDWVFVTPRSAVATLQFLPEGRFGPSVPSLSGWKVRYDEKKSVVALDLEEESGRLFARMSLCPRRGIWVGRCADGHVALSPERDSGVWLKYANPARLEVSRRRAGVDHRKKEVFTHRQLPPAALDWSGAYSPITSEISESNFPGDRSNAIALVGCNRPKYFATVANSIAANPEAARWPIFVFLDRPVRSHELDMMAEQAGIAAKIFPRAVVVRRKKNLGCGRNLIDVRRQLFDLLGFRRVWVFEDDLVITPGYISFVARLLDWGLSRWDNVGVAQGWNFSLDGSQERFRFRSRAEVTFDNWWGYCQTLESWEAMRGVLYRYEELFLGGVYGERPHKSIVEWFRLQLRLSEGVPRSFKSPCDDGPAVRRFDWYWNAPPTGQDAATMVALRSEGFVRLAPSVSRAEYIGRDGIHMNPAWFDRKGFDRCPASVFPDDGVLEFYLRDCSPGASSGEVPAVQLPGIRYLQMPHDGG